MWVVSRRFATSYRPQNLYEMTTLWSDELNIRSDCELGAVETKAQKAVRPLAVPSFLSLSYTNLTL